MNKPTLEQYGLTQDFVQKFKEMDEQIEKKTVWAVFCFNMIWVFLWILKQGLIKDPFLLIVCSILGFAFILFPSVVLSFGIFQVVKLIYRFLNKNYDIYRKYTREIGKYTEWYRRTKLEFWNSLKGQVLEVEVAGLFKKSGYEVQLTPRTDDKGVDIVLNNNIIVQCKGHTKPVSPAVVRELYGTLKHFKASKAILVCPVGFTKGVRDFVSRKPIDLMDSYSLVNIQEKLEK